ARERAGEEVLPRRLGGHDMTPKGFSHTGLSTRDLDRTREFYEDVLGFEAVRCDILKNRFLSVHCQTGPTSSRYQWGHRPSDELCLRELAMVSGWLSRLQRRLGFTNASRQRRPSARRRNPLSPPQDWILEERCLLSATWGFEDGYANQSVPRA